MRTLSETAMAHYSFTNATVLPCLLDDFSQFIDEFFNPFPQEMRLDSNVQFYHNPLPTLPPSSSSHQYLHQSQREPTSSSSSILYPRASHVPEFCSFSSSTPTSARMLRPLIDEYFLAKLMNKTCSSKFTDEWLATVKREYLATFVPVHGNTANGCTGAMAPSSSSATAAGSSTLVGGASPSDGEELVTHTILVNVNNAEQQMRAAGAAAALGGGSVRVRDGYLKSLCEIVAHIGRVAQQSSSSSLSSPNGVVSGTMNMADVVGLLLQDIRSYVHNDQVARVAAPAVNTNSAQTAVTTNPIIEAIGAMSITDEDVDQRSRHFSSISDGSNSSDGSTNLSPPNHQLFESILSRLLKLRHACSEESSTLEQIVANGAPQAVRPVESREDFSSGYGRSSSASSNDSANISTGNAPTLGSLAVNIGSVLSDSGNGSPTAGFFRAKNSSSSASSLATDPNLLTLKDFMDDAELNKPELKRSVTNPVDELFRVRDHISPSSSLSSQGISFDSRNQYFDDTEFAGFGLPELDNTRMMSPWMDSGVPANNALAPGSSLHLEHDYFNSTLNPVTIMSVVDNNRINRSYSVGAARNEPSSFLASSGAESAPVAPSSFASDSRKNLYKLIVGQLMFDGYQSLARQLIQVENLGSESLRSNNRLHTLFASSGVKGQNDMPTTLKPVGESSLITQANEADSFFGPNLYSSCDSFTPSFNRSNSVSVTMASSSPMTNRIFNSQRSQSQVAVTNTILPRASTPLTAPVLLDISPSSNFMLNETAIKNINQLNLLQSNNNSVTPGAASAASSLGPVPALIPAQIVAASVPPSHTTGNGKSHREMSIKVKFGSLGPGNNQFSSPHGFCLGFNEEIVIADTHNHRICVYDKSGNYKHSFGVCGRMEGQLWNPRKIATITLNRCGVETQCYVICDRGQERSRMQIFTRSGNFYRRIVIRFMDIVAGIVVNENNEIVAVDSVNPTVFVMNDVGDIRTVIDCSNHMREPSDIAIFKNEYYVCDFKGHCVVVFNQMGEFMRKIGSSAITSFPNGIDIATNGDILVGDSHGNRFHLVIFNPTGQVVAEYECPQVKVSRCCGLKLTREGYIVTLAKNNHHVLVLNSLFNL